MWAPVGGGWWVVGRGWAATRLVTITNDGLCDTRRGVAPLCSSLRGCTLRGMTNATRGAASRMGGTMRGMHMHTPRARTYSSIGQLCCVLLGRFFAARVCVSGRQVARGAGGAPSHVLAPVSHRPAETLSSRNRRSLASCCMYLHVSTWFSCGCTASRRTPSIMYHLPSCVMPGG